MTGLENAQFPSHLEKNKGKSWIRKYVKACYDDFQGINTESFYAGRNRYANINRYMIGRQDPIPSLRNLGDRTANPDKSSLKVPKDILSIASKYARMMVATLSKSEWAVDIQAIDPTSIEETTDYYADAKARIVLKKEFAAMGLDPEEFFEDTDKNFQNEEDLDLYMEYSYKHRIAIEAEQAIRLILNNCEFDAIREQMLKQLVYFGFAGYKDYFDQNGDVKIRFVDVNNFITSRCRYTDFRDAQYMGEILDLSIADIKEMDYNKEIDEEQWVLLAQKLQSRTSGYGTERQVNPIDYEMYRVQVLDVEFYSINEMIIETGKNKLGNLALSTKTELNKKAKDNSYESKEYKVVYEGKWVVGTDIYFGCKLQTNMKRPNTNISDVKLSYHAVCPMLDNMETKSIGEDMIPIQRMIELVWTKYKQAVIDATTKGIAIEIGALENIPLGLKEGETLTPPQMLQFYRDTGNLVYRRLDEEGKNASYKPIETLENGIGDEANNWFREVGNQIFLLQQITGYNDLTDGSTPEARTLNGVAKQAAESTNNSIDFMKRGERKIYESALFSIMIRVQDAAKSGKLEGYINALGKSSIEFFKLSPEVSARELGLTIKDAPDVFQKEALQEKVNLAIQSGQITLADSFIIENIPVVKHAEALLAIRIQKNLEEQQKINLQNIEAQSKVQQDSAAMASQLKQQEVQMDTQSKMAIIEAEKQKEMELLNLKYSYELQLKQMEVGGRIEQNSIQARAKEYAADRQSKTKEMDTATTLQNSNIQKMAEMEHEKEMSKMEKKEPK
jgi:hypothetical protein